LGQESLKRKKRERRKGSREITLDDADGPIVKVIGVKMRKKRLEKQGREEERRFKWRSKMVQMEDGRRASDDRNEFVCGLINADLQSD
jgi:hypothetical protein